MGEHSLVPPPIFEGPCNLDEPSQWSSPDGSTVVWYVGNGDLRIQTDDHRRAARLRRMTRVLLVGECIAGGPFQQLFVTDRRKLRNETMRRLLWWGVGPGKQRGEFGPETVAELATVTSAGS